MSTGNKRSYATMHAITLGLLERLRPHCARIEIAGSVRRQKAECTDLEFVVIAQDEALNAYLTKLMEDGKIQHKTPRRWGEKYKAFVFQSQGAPLGVDIFIQTPATWGLNFMIRTGSSDFSRKMVTSRSKGGWKPDHYLIKEARVWDAATGEALPTLEEEEVFRLWGMDSVEPKQRTEFYQPILKRIPSIIRRPSNPATIQEKLFTDAKPESNTTEPATPINLGVAAMYLHDLETDADFSRMPGTNASRESWLEKAKRIIEAGLTNKATQAKALELAERLAKVIQNKSDESKA